MIAGGRLAVWAGWGSIDVCELQATWELRVASFGS